MRLCIDAGHGGGDWGATFADLKEKDVALDLAKRAATIAAEASIDVMLTRETDHYLGRLARAGLSNEWNADAFVSVHLNADADPDEPGDPEARGIECLHWWHSGRGQALAEAIGASLVAATGERWRGAKEVRPGDRGETVLHYTDAPAVIVEVGFLDCRATAAGVKDPAVLDRYARAIIEGVRLWAGLGPAQDTPPA